MSLTTSLKTKQLTKKEVKEILADYRLACESREASLMGRKEVFMGKAKFGIFGDGKELPQIAMAKFFQKGDWRSGYYRDQTFMMSIGELNLEQYFAQLYAHTSVDKEPASAGRQMNGHFATRSLDENGKWKNLMAQYNSSGDISPTAGQMPRLLGLAYASKLFKENKELHQLKQFSNKGNEVAFGTIGNASTSEGMFWESMNAAGVMQVPMVMSVWDDGYGISVPNKYHTIKESISKALAGFQQNGDGHGFDIYTVKGWDYTALIKTFEKAVEKTRKTHVPALVHVVEVTQPQGHSTSGSHERYKSKERLDWEKDHDCILKMREWILEMELAEESTLVEIEKESKTFARESKNNAWKSFMDDIYVDQNLAIEYLSLLAEQCSKKSEIETIIQELKATINPIRLDAIAAVKKALRLVREESCEAKQLLIGWVKRVKIENFDRFSAKLHSESNENVGGVELEPAQYVDGSETVDGREILQACFKENFKRDPKLLVFGEDVGKIGDVNQAFAGLQEEFGENRVTDTSIREISIIGQGIGCALRGLRPIAEIQYLDYLVYALAPLTDDLATLQYRTKSGQKAPLIVRTRGHRLEGIWHSGSPMQMMLGSLRGMHILVPRNMTQAAGMYNTLFRSDEPAVMIECLNGYRQKEKLPKNVGSFTLPLGKTERLAEGEDITLVSYGATLKIVLQATEQLKALGISCEVIDVQTLLPFDLDHDIVQSIAKTNRVVFIDEDVPGGASAFMMQKVVEEQNAYRFLDSQPRTIAAKAHRPAYGSDGDYFSKPNTDDIVDEVYSILSEVDPEKYPEIY